MNERIGRMCIESQGRVQGGPKGPGSPPPPRN